MKKIWNESLKIPIFKILISFQRKSRIIKYSSDLPLENMICKHDIPALLGYAVIQLQDNWRKENVSMDYNMIFDI